MLDSKPSDSKYSIKPDRRLKDARYYHNNNNMHNADNFNTNNKGEKEMNWITRQMKKKEIERQHFNAAVQGVLLTKCDRIITRIDNFRRGVRRQNHLIAVEDFDKFVKDIEILIQHELTIRGNTRDNKIIYLYSGKAKDWKKLDTTHHA